MAMDKNAEGWFSVSENETWMFWVAEKVQVSPKASKNPLTSESQQKH